MVLQRSAARFRDAAPSMDVLHYIGSGCIGFRASLGWCWINIEYSHGDTLDGLENDVVRP